MELLQSSLMTEWMLSITITICHWSLPSLSSWQIFWIQSIQSKKPKCLLYARQGVEPKTRVNIKSRLHKANHLKVFSTSYTCSALLPSPLYQLSPSAMISFRSPVICTGKIGERKKYSCPTNLRGKEEKVGRARRISPSIPPWKITNLAYLSFKAHLKHNVQPTHQKSVGPLEKWHLKEATALAISYFISRNDSLQY